MSLGQRVFAVVSVRRNPLPNVRYLGLFDLLNPELHALYSEQSWIRWCQRKLLRAPTLALRFRRLERRGRIFWATNWRHLRYVQRCPVVLDLDDPTFAPKEIATLRKAPSLLHLVVTTEALKRHFEAVDIRCPITVIPNGFMPLTPELQGASARERWTRERWVPLFGTQTFQATRIIYAATLIRWEDIQLAIEAERNLPPAVGPTCWLFIGRPRGFDTTKLRKGNVAFLDYVPHAELQEYLAGAHVGLYPRTTNFEGRMHIKLIEYAASGLAILGVRSSATEEWAASGALAAAPSEQFCHLVACHLADHERLAALATRAATLIVDLEWPRLARRYLDLFMSIPFHPTSGYVGR